MIAVMNEHQPDTLLYLYGVVPANAPEPPAELRGIEGRPVRRVKAAGMAGIVSELPAAEYVDDALNARLDDLAWVGERGLAHETVLSWYADQGTVVPLSLFSLHQDEGRVRERLEGGADRFRSALERLAGRKEWGVKVWRVDEIVGQHLEDLSPSIRALSQEIEAAPPGRRFLLQKKRETMRAEELRTAGTRVAQQVYGTLRTHAERAAVVPLPARAPEGVRALALHAALLVPDRDFEAFQQAISVEAHRYQPMGFEFEFTGPWPPYHFAELDGD
jgi:hypothetical protein